MFGGVDLGLYRARSASRRIASLIETAKIKGIDPFDYLKTTVEHIDQGHSKDSLQELITRNFKPSST